MSNGFDFFEGSRSETQTPQVTVRRSGQMVLTPPAVAMLGDDVTHVQMGYDADTGGGGSQGRTQRGEGPLPSPGSVQRGSLVDGCRFLAHHGLKVEKAQRFPAEEFGKGLVGFRFPKAETAAKEEGQTAQGKSAQTGKRKAAATA